MLPTFSVIIPSYNRSASARAAVESVLRQDYPADRFEIIVVDDGSEPPLSLAAADGRVRILHEINRGPAAARNRGAEVAGGELLAFLDDDCVAEPEWLHAMAHALGPRRDCVIGGATMNGLPENACACATDLLVSVFVQRERGFLPSNNFAVAAASFREIGGFEPSFRAAAGEDREFCARAIACGYQLAHCPEARVVHRHAMSFGEFLRQHYNYGRGALLFRRMQPARANPFGFLARLLKAAFERRSPQLAFLLLCSQVATTAGFAREWLRFRPGTAKLAGGLAE